MVEAGYGGFLSAFARTPNAARLLDGLGADWEAGKVGFKMYPNVTSIHAALDGLRAILVEERLRAGEIAEIEVGCGHMTFVHTAWDYRPAGITAAQMNMFYGLERDGAAPQRGGRATIPSDDRGPARSWPSSRGSRSRSTPRSKPGARRSATPRASTVRTTDGRTFSREVCTAAAARRIPSRGRTSNASSRPISPAC